MDRHCSNQLDSIVRHVLDQRKETRKLANELAGEVVAEVARSKAIRVVKHPDYREPQPVTGGDSGLV